MLETALGLAAKPLVEALVNKLVVPKIEKCSKWCKGKYKEYMIPRAEHFQDYLERAYAKYSIVNTLVFHNSQRLLKDIYVTQTIHKTNSSWDDEETTSIDHFPKELLKKYQKMLITDTAGMGKSTITKRMFIDLIDNGMEGLGIPIYIELNRLNQCHTILQEVQKELNSLSEEFDSDLLLKFIQTGGFIFFLDGYDEISISDRDEVTQNIKDFISKASAGNIFILTSRQEGNLMSFGDFQSFSIQHLTEDEAYELLTKYDTSKNKELSSKLVELLQSGEYDSMGAFMENPLLVSLLFTAYDYNRSIPLEKHRFYEKVVEAYFEKHDNTKAMKKREKYSGLNYDGFDRILRYIGFDCLIKTGVKFKKDTILNTIRNAKEFCGITNFFENDLLEDLVSTVPLFCTDSTDYKWVHKSLLEYFAARFIFCDAKQNQDKILRAIYKSENLGKYLNMLDIYNDVDAIGFNKYFILPLCEDYLEFYKKNDFKTNSLNQKLINQRIGLLFYLGIGDIHLIVRPPFTNKNEMIKVAHEVREKLEKEISINGDLFDRRRSNYSRSKHKDMVFYFDSSTKYIDNIRGLFSLVHTISRRTNNLSLYEFHSPDLPICTNIEYDKHICIDIHTGEDNENTFIGINEVLFSLPLLPPEQAIFNYEACIAEVERIKNELAQNESLSDLVNGI